MNSESPRFQSPEFRALPSRILWQVIRFALIVLLSTTAYAQYGGMPGTTGMGTPTYGHGAAIGIGVGAAAGGVAAVYLLTHRTSKVSGCVRAADDGLRLTDDKTQKTLSLVNETTDIKPGERVELKGKIKKGAEGKQNLLVKSVTKDFGPCQANASASNPVQAK